MKPTNIYFMFSLYEVRDLECPNTCHENAQCIELVFGGRKCVCNPGYEGDGIDCAGELLVCFFKFNITLQLELIDAQGLGV